VSSTVGAGGEVATNVQDAVGEVDVLPAEREQLALPEPGERGDLDHRRDQGIARGAGDGVNVLDREHVELVGAPDDDPLRVRARVRGDSRWAGCCATRLSVLPTP
jgi:hypothetical protein